MLVSIIIPVFNQWPYTEKCLKSIQQYTTYPHEIIIIDNGSKDETVKELTGNSAIKLLTNPHNLGFARACNQGAKIARGELLLFLNNDTIVTPDWLRSMVNLLTDSKIGVVGNKLLFPDTNRIQHAGVFLQNKLPGHIYYNQPGNFSESNIKKIYPAVTGACLLTRKILFLEVGGFDETYINGYEDVDYCLKIWEKGYKVIYCPDSIIYHYGSTSTGRHLLEKQNLACFLEKWKNKLKSGKIINENPLKNS